MRSGLKNIKDQLTATTPKVSVKELIVRGEKEINVDFFINFINFIFKINGFKL